MLEFEILDDRSIIIVSGQDALKFLQNYTTNDISKYDYSYNYMLNNQGRYLFDFFVYKAKDNQEDIFYIDILTSQSESFIQKMSMYKLRADVEIKNISSDFHLLYIKNTDATEADLVAIEKISNNLVYCLQDSRFDKLGYRALVKKGDNFKDISSQMTLSDNLYLNDKYYYTIIDGALDLTQEKSIPIEFAGEEQNAISFTKGCYVGQEVISRAKHQGVVRKKIYQVKGDLLAKLTEHGKVEEKLILRNQDGKKLGTLLSCLNGVGIAQLREEELKGQKGEKVFLDVSELNMLELNSESNKTEDAIKHSELGLEVKNPIWLAS